MIIPRYFNGFLYFTLMIFQFIILEEGRYVEFHTSYGRFYRLRIPHFGRDMAFCKEISEAYIVGCQYVSSLLIYFLN